MQKTLKSMKLLVKEISHKAYFWPLMVIILAGLFLDIHSTCLCVVNVGIWGEESDFLRFLFREFHSLGLNDWLSIVLAMLLSKIILLFAVAVAFSTVVWAGRGSRVFLNIILAGICLLFLYQIVLGGLNYYHYFLL